MFMNGLYLEDGDLAGIMPGGWVQRGTRVRFQGNIISDAAIPHFYMSATELTRWAREIEKRGFVQVQTSSSYNRVTAEATLNNDKQRMEGAPSVALDFVEAAKVAFHPGGLGSIDVVNYNIDPVPDSPNTGNAGGNNANQQAPVPITQTTKKPPEEKPDEEESQFYKDLKKAVAAVGGTSTLVLIVGGLFALKVLKG